MHTLEYLWILVELRKRLLAIRVLPASVLAFAGAGSAGSTLP